MHSRKSISSYSHPRPRRPRARRDPKLWDAVTSRPASLMEVPPHSHPHSTFHLHVPTNSTNLLTSNRPPSSVDPEPSLTTRSAEPSTLRYPRKSTVFSSSSSPLQEDQYEASASSSPLQEDQYGVSASSSPFLQEEEKQGRNLRFPRHLQPPNSNRSTVPSTLRYPKRHSEAWKMSTLPTALSTHHSLMMKETLHAAASHPSVRI